MVVKKKKAEMRLAPSDEFFLQAFPGVFKASWDHFINRRATLRLNQSSHSLPLDTHNILNPQANSTSRHCFLCSSISSNCVTCSGW